MARKKKTDKKDAGDAAWARLTAQTRPLDSESRNRHAEARPAASNKPKPRTGAKTGAKADASKDLQQADAPAPIKAQTKPQKKIRTKIRTKTRTETQTETQAKAGPTLQDALPPKTRRRLARGTIAIDATLDLHGMTLTEAEAALTAFIGRARARRQSWVLVITGKGRHSEGGRGQGRLRGALPDWLDRGALAGQVVEYAPAAPNHGGGGAFYLRLRRLKSV